jgi:hypothetical protein
METLRGCYQHEMRPDSVLVGPRNELFAQTKHYGEEIHPKIIEFIESFQAALGMVSKIEPFKNIDLLSEMKPEFDYIRHLGMKLQIDNSNQMTSVEKLRERVRTEMASAAERMDELQANETVDSITPEGTAPLLSVL